MPLRSPDGSATLRSVLGLPASFTGAALEFSEPRLQILDEGRVGALVHVIEFVRVGFEIVQFLLAIVVLDILVGPGPDRLEGGRAAGSDLGQAAKLVLTFFALGFSLGLALSTALLHG